MLYFLLALYKNNNNNSNNNKNKYIDENNDIENSN